MNKLKTLFKQHFWLIALIGLALIAIGIFILGGYLEEKSFDKTVSTQTNQANTAVRESQNSQSVAANYSIERRAEDAVRERVIKPKLDDARRRSSNSKSNFEAAKKNYEVKKTDTENLTSDDLDNCRNLADLFPEVRFENCP